jgi:hypothetical protein
LTPSIVTFEKIINVSPYFHSNINIILNDYLTLTHTLHKYKPTTNHIPNKGRRHRNKSPTNKYSVASESIPTSPTNDHVYNFQLLPSIAHRGNHPPLSLTVKALRNGAVQIRVNEEEHKVTPRWER